MLSAIDEPSKRYLTMLCQAQGPLLEITGAGERTVWSAMGCAWVASVQVRCLAPPVTTLSQSPAVRRYRYLRPPLLPNMVLFVALISLPPFEVLFDFTYLTELGD